MKQHLGQATVQKLALTQHMRSSLSLLQIGLDELNEATENEAKRNPFLKSVPRIPSSGRGAVGSEGFESDDIEDQQTNIDAILEQVSLIRFDQSQSRLARELTYCLDDRGFLSDPAEEICGYLNAELPHLLEVVQILQKSVEPAGVFAWSLKDCFRIQLEAKNRYDTLIAKLLDRLDLVAQQELVSICNLCGVDREDAAEMLADIRLLTPAPLQPVTQLPETSRAPELIFDQDDDGKISVRLNEVALPQMLADDAMFSAVKAIETDQKAMAYYRDCYRGAASFVIAMQKRANTLLRVGQVIAGNQEKFIRTGRSLDKKPLTMGALASELGLNKSTVSRALSNCLIETKRGLLNPIDCLARPLNEESPERTREQVLQRLSLLIRTENKNAPHSDEELARQLANAKFKISRRTVAKYRGLLDIRGVYQRREIVQFKTSDSNVTRAESPPRV